MARLGERRPRARALLSRALRAKGAAGVMVRPEEAEVAGMLADAGWARVEERVEGTVIDYRWVPRRVVIPGDVRVEVAEALGRLDPVEERSRLLVMAGSEPVLEAEMAALRAEAPEAALRAPPGSAVAGAPWSVYSAAMRAAACWARAEREGERLSERELAARALGWSKGWTPARRRAFEAIVGRRFGEAVTGVERFIRVAGPVRWRLDGVEADARAGDPWLGIPERSVGRFQLLDTTARRALVIENLETFEETVRSGVLSDVAVIYGGGFVSHAVVDLLSRLPLPVAAWCDLDPDGLRIGADLSRRLDRPVAPLGMGSELLHSPYSRPATARQLADAEAAVTELAEPWSALAAAIQDTRRVCEQEAIHGEVLRAPPAG